MIATSVLKLVLLLVFSGAWVSAQFPFGEYDPHYADKVAKDSSSASESGFNFYRKRCTYDRQCDEGFGYICRDGKCSCKFGRPDSSDAFKCKVEVKLGDFCKELPRDFARFPVYIRRKCPHNSECGESSRICECGPLFLRRGFDCVPKILNAGDKSCRLHMDCMIQRGQQCYNGTCVECGVGRFKNFRPMAKWVEARPECTCFDKLTELQENGTTTHFRHQNKRGEGLKGRGGSCTPPISVGDHCTVSANCVSPWTPQLVCDDGVCTCPPGSRSFQYPQSSSHPLSTFCILPINSPCTEDKDCHGPTAYCEQRLEVPTCKCRDGYDLENTVTKGKKDAFLCSSRFHEEVCGKFFPQNDRLRDQLKDQRLSCIQGIYECARPQEMYWDKERGKCVSLVGGRCDLNLFDKSSCAGSSRCWEYKGLGEFRCQCPLHEGEVDDNQIFSDIYQNQQVLSGGGDGVRLKHLRSGSGSRVVRFKPSRDRRDCVRSDL